MRHCVLGLLLVYIATIGSFAGFGVLSIERKIETAKLQAISAVLVEQNIKVLSELHI